MGTYRLLAPGRSDRLYADSEFHLGALAGIRRGLVEAGRACVHPDHRDGAVVGLMWAGIARYMVTEGYGWLAGCCSVPTSEAAEIMGQVPLAPPEYRVTPLLPWPVPGHARADRDAGDGGKGNGGKEKGGKGKGGKGKGGEGDGGDARAARLRPGPGDRGGRGCRPCSGVTSGWAPGSAARPPTTRSSVSPTSSSCSRCPP
nr:hypothetical protein GCM10020093_081080 [Planobispora longispora]